MAGERLADMGLPDETRHLRRGQRYCVKEAVMPFGRFPGADSLLGPEMKSTGEVMGVASDFPRAYAKTQLAIDYSMPSPRGKVRGAFISVCDRDKRAIVAIARDLHNLGFELLSTTGTMLVLKAAGLPVRRVLKKHEGRPNIIDVMTNGEVALVVNTPHGQEARADGYRLRTAAIRHTIPNITNIATANAMVQAIFAMQNQEPEVTALQDFSHD
jgi:carbamoyl-phosphate synthase large subunit